ncbi:MAG: hypothetical protein V4640_09275 [Verrucomicrobiota bacterium]
MNPRASAIFSCALDVPEPVRDALLLRLCADDRCVEAEVRSMLEDAKRADLFFNEPQEHAEVRSLNRWRED